MDKKEINVFLVGPGNVGSTLLRQIHKSQKVIKPQPYVQTKVCGILTTKAVVVNTNGIDLFSWKESLQKRQDYLTEFVEIVHQVNLPNKVFVDCTTSDALVEFYEPILKNSVNIVTCNKKANSSTLKRYQAIRKASREGNVKFLYETNVGAAIPVIQLIQDFLKTGDKIHRIEGVLSGTLSYIFNNFKNDVSFSETVKDACEKGYTEPDPRDDLNGIDVARKILILARESGLDAEFENIEIENLVPKSCRQVANVNELFRKLEEEDIYFERLKKKSAEKGEMLSYIGTVDVQRRKLSCRLISITSLHPFYPLKESDNKIAITTQRYKQTPMILQGPGAGNEVTASGVFADILKC